MKKKTPAPVATLSSDKDALGRAEALEKLGDSEQQWGFSFESLNDYAIFALSLDGTITSWNAGGEALFGCTPADIVGCNFAHLFTPQEIAHGLPQQQLHKATLHGCASIEFILMRKDDSRFRASGKLTIGSSTTVINAPIVATGTGSFDVTKHTNTHERVVAIDTAKKTVTLLLVHGFANGQKVLYISTEATDPGVAMIERATYVPSLAKAMGGTIPIFVIANGPTGDKPQGLAFAALDGHLTENLTAANASTLRASMNVLASLPTGAGAYTPLWSANSGVWSAAAVATRKNVQLTKPQQFADAAARKRAEGSRRKAVRTDRRSRELRRNSLPQRRALN